ncbi:aldehyde dehydrogenase (NAD+) [Microbacteriaceae bacterium MWH-Ta3]|nr:aldehyde dehydrogenase (NAD+) [Microbacteriaceae bacterium MWH-Ta3]
MSSPALPPRGHLGLVIVDMQNDFLAELDPPERERIIGAVAALRDRCRAAGVPVLQVMTEVDPTGEDAMPHWQGALRCVRGTRGAQAPAALGDAGLDSLETKQHYAGLASHAGHSWVQEHNLDTVIVAGIHTHACVRETALAAYRQGLRVAIARDTVASYDEDHAAASLDWLSGRAATVVEDSLSLVVESAGAPQPTHSGDPATNLGEVSQVVDAAHRARREWSAQPLSARRAALVAWADDIAAHHDELARAISAQVHKPLAMAEDEVRRSESHIRVASDLYATGRWNDRTIDDGVTVRHVPLGVVALIMPWNNPLAIPAGKIAAALMTGNTIVIKPSPLADSTTRLLVDSALRSGIPADAIGVVSGGADTARELAASPLIDGVAITGSIAAGRSIAQQCAERGIPLQAELGGNNALILADDVDIPSVVPAILHNAWAFAGQRCTAIRRVIVPESRLAEWESAVASFIDDVLHNDHALTESYARVISPSAAERIRAEVAAAEASSARLVARLAAPAHSTSGTTVAHVEPVVVVCRDAADPIVQRESFGPVLVTQPARSNAGALDVDHAMELANGVEQGLVMAVCSSDDAVIAEVRAGARVGIVSIGPGPVPVHAEAPFGGWKASGVGPPEHGEWDAQFFLRPQAEYRSL